MIFGYYKNCLYTHRYKFSSEKKKKKSKESQYMVSHPETGSDPPIGSDRESRRDIELLSSSSSSSSLVGGMCIDIFKGYISHNV